MNTSNRVLIGTYTNEKKDKSEKRLLYKSFLNYCTNGLKNHTYNELIIDLIKDRDLHIEEISKEYNWEIDIVANNYDNLLEQFIKEHNTLEKHYNNIVYNEMYDLLKKSIDNVYKEKHNLDYILSVMYTDNFKDKYYLDLIDNFDYDSIMTKEELTYYFNKNLTKVLNTIKKEYKEQAKYDRTNQPSILQQLPSGWKAYFLISFLTKGKIFKLK